MRRHTLKIGATAITEGTANFLVNRRMNKSQQMRWSRRGANLLLQVRCAVYNGTLGSGYGQKFHPANDTHPLGDCRLTPNLRRSPRRHATARHPPPTSGSTPAHKCSSRRREAAERGPASERWFRRLKGGGGWWGGWWG